MTREIIKKRVGSDGVEIDCEQDDVRWVDIKETKKARYKRGRGRAFQRTIYTHLNDNNERQYEDPPKITFKNPEASNPETTQIEYLKTKAPNHGIVKSIHLRSGRGKFYIRTKLHFNNSDDNDVRQVREQQLENPENGDYIIVERIKRLTNQWGRGRVFQRKHVHLLHEEEDIEAMDGPCKQLP